MNKRSCSKQFRPARLARSVGVGFAAAAAITVFAVASDRFMGSGSPLVFYLWAVIVAAWLGSATAGVAATLFSALMSVAVFLWARDPSAIEFFNKCVRIIVFTGEGVLVSWLIGSLRAATRSAESAHEKLRRAYEATIDGWSRALDLRDRETDGHSRRVADLTLFLAREMGVSDSDLLQVRRGAMLHDIGKLGVPDAILLKPGPLNDEEWTIMKRHPDFAHAMLWPIEFLRPAIDIPFCHHEHWDGSGYPRGLRGEEIPLAARIFAAVDIWDALRNDRPYRKAWPRDRVLEYIRSLAGSHLDPAVVAVFMRALHQEGASRVRRSAARTAREAVQSPAA